MKNKWLALLLLVVAPACLAERIASITYPRKNINPDDVFTQETLEKSISYLFSWQQGAGVFGGLTLHGCWGETGVIQRKYHGQFTSANRTYLNIMLDMYEATGDYKWNLRAEKNVANVMFLQTKSGGFYHGSAEFEPSYDENKTCAIHQCMPELALLEYAAKPYAHPELKKEIKKVIDKHWKWFNGQFYKKGTRGVTDKQGWPWPCWSGVTNQDMVVIEALAKYGKVFNDMSRYEEFGKPALDVLLSDRYYYKGLGLFQRGDQPAWTFPERTPYYHIIFSTLNAIHEITGDKRIPPILDDVCEQGFRATFVAEDGLRYFSHGVNVKMDNGKMEIVSRNKYPTSVTSILDFMEFFDWYLERHPDPEKKKIQDDLYKTAAAYMRTDGTLPIALNPENDIFALAPSNPTKFLLWKLNGKITNVEIEDLPPLQRKINNLVWYENGRFYEVTKDGARVFAGCKLEPKGIVLGTDETMANVDFDRAREHHDDAVVEIMDIRYDKEKTF